MLDVHPPHGNVHGWRDFLLHLATITIGLLIAIGLEQTVEWFHHRHLVREARENIREEIRQNEGETHKDIAAVQANADNMTRNMKMAGLLLHDPHALDNKEMHFTFAWSSFNASAWRSAQATGAVTYMPVAEVQQYADIYNQQEIVQQQAVAIFTRQAEIAAPLNMYDNGSALPPADVHALMLDSAQAAMRLNVLRQLIENLEREYQDALK